jgi:hypothetical protein
MWSPSGRHKRADPGAHADLTGARASVCGGTASEARGPACRVESGADGGALVGAAIRLSHGVT